MKHPSHLNLPEAPAWSILLGDLGRSLVYAAILLFACSSVSWFLSRRFHRLEKLGSRSFTLGTLCLLGVLGVLAVLFLTDQFHYAYVFSHSDSITRSIYKFAAVWSGQEGSFLLWACTAGVFGVAAARRTGGYRRWFTICYAIFLLTLTSILAYESPFRINYIDGKALLPPTGTGLQPSLLNIWLVIHPPTIFAGFGSLSVLYCWAMSALLTKDLRSWIQWIRPWALASFTVLGLGLCMGGLWAYETLGWGGFWAWDPVENSSFVPWCFVVAFLHGIFVQSRTGRWCYANLLLAATSMLFFLFGTFLTRSGILKDTSVHSFAQMDRYALQLLVGLMVVSIVGFGVPWIYGLWGSVREKSVVRQEVGQGFTRGLAYKWGIVLISFIGLATAIGMSVPLIKSFMGQSIAIVEPILYHQVLSWFFIPLLFIISVGPFLNWQHISFKKFLMRISNVFALTFGLLGVVLLFLQHPKYGVVLDKDSFVEFPFGVKLDPLPWMIFLIGLCLLGLIANLWRFVEKRHHWASAGGFVAHMGMIILLGGLILSKGFERKRQLFVQEGRPGFAFDRWIRFQGLSENFLARDNRILFEVVGRDDHFQASPVLYYVPQLQGEPMAVARPYIRRNGLNDMYFSIGPAIYEAETMNLKKREERFFDKMLVRYNGIERIGERSKVGTKFFAHVVVQTSSKKLHLTPYMEIGEHGVKFEPVRVNENYLLYLQRMDAKDYSVTLQFFFIKPVFPVEVFMKPMVIFVWIGTGLMTLGGFWALLYRKKTLRDSLKIPSSFECKLSELAGTRG